LNLCNTIKSLSNSFFLKIIGQTFKKIGIYLPMPVFSHGQLYVAFSRTSKLSNLRIKILDFEGKQGQLQPNKFFTKNIVYEALIDKDSRFT